MWKKRQGGVDRRQRAAVGLPPAPPRYSAGGGVWTSCVGGPLALQSAESGFQTGAVPLAGS